MTARNTDSLTRFKIDDEVFELDIADLEIREVVEIERYLDKPWGVINSGEWLDSIQAIVVLAFLAKRRSEPLTTLAQVENASKIELMPDERPTETPATDGAPSSGKSQASKRGKSRASDKTS